jgi:hypothetical protein
VQSPSCSRKKVDGARYIVSRNEAEAEKDRLHKQVIEDALETQFRNSEKPSAPPPTDPTCAACGRAECWMANATPTVLGYTVLGLSVGRHDKLTSWWSAPLGVDR